MGLWQSRDDEISRSRECRALQRFMKKNHDPALGEKDTASQQR